MNVRKSFVWNYHRLRGYGFPRVYDKIQKDIRLGRFKNPDGTPLAIMLLHCKNNVPYYSDLDISSDNAASKYDDMLRILRTVPVMTKDVIRENFQKLHSGDLSERKWYFNTSGGSTGEPIKLIQDRDYCGRAAAITFLFYWLVGHEIGRKMVRLYNKDVDWKGDRHKIDLIEFLKRTNELDGDYTLQCLEKFMYGVV